MSATVSQYMQSQVVTVGSDESLAELERTLAREGINGVPVVDGGKLVGVVSRADVLRALVEEKDEADLQADYYREAGWSASAARKLGAQDAEALGLRKVSEVMSTKLLTISKDASVADAARLMLEHRVHRLPVTDGDALAGILSSQDILRLVAEQRS